MHCGIDVRGTVHRRRGSDAQRFGALHKEKDAIPSIVGFPDWFTDLTQISVLNKRIVVKINIVLYRCESSASKH